MNNKKILSIITLAGVIGMNTQSIAENTTQSNNITLLANRSISSNIQEEVDSNVHNIQDNVITINNVWRQNIGSLKFNPLTNKIEFIKGWAESNPYLSVSSEAFSISLYKSNGELIKSVQVNGGGEHPEDKLYNAFNNLDYSYGDILTIDYKTSSRLSISNFNNEKNYQVNKPISMEITKSGLKELFNKLIVNPIYFDLGSNKINVSGKATPNSAVNIWVNNKDYITTANSKGQYNLEITVTGKITPDTVVKVFNEGNDSVQKNVELNPSNYKLNYTSISLNGYWGGNPYLVSKISFNQYTKKLDVENRGNVYFSWSSGSPAYTITLLNKSGKIIKSEKYNGSGSSQNVYNDFNGLSFEYGDSIQITSYGLDMSINNPNGKIDNIPGSGTKTVSYEITQNGLKELSNNLTVNPIYFDLGNNKINVSGKATPNSAVNIWVDNKDYVTTSNSNGEYNLDINTSKNITTDTVVTVFNEGNEEVQKNVELNPNKYKLNYNNISLYGNWGGIYLVSKINFDQENKKIEIINDGTKYFCGDTSSIVYTVTLYNKNGDVIKSETYKGGDTNNNLYKDFNGLSFNYGDYIKIKSNGLNMSVANFDGQAEYKLNGSDNPTILYEITNSGLKDFNIPKVNIIGKTISLSSYPNSEVNIIIDGKKYTYKTDNKGNLNVEVAVNINYNTPVNISVINEQGITTIPTNYYLNGSNIAKEFTFNMHREASINPNDPVAKKGDCMPLTSFEPLGVQMLSKGKIKIDIKGNVTGYATLRVNDGLRENINQKIPVNTPTIIDLPKGGGLILNTSNIMLKGGSIDTPFNFKVDLDTMNTPYREIPVFDNRTDVKMCSYATNNSQTFYNEINSGDNQNYGAVIIGNHIRMYMPKASFLGKDFNAQQTVKTYNDTFISDNELNGLTPDAKDQLNRFHTNFFYVTAQYPPIGNSGAWLTDGNGTWTVPGLFPGCLTEPGWVLFHEVGHIFDPGWADSYMGCEVYSNMYTMDTQLKLQGKTTWAWNGMGRVNYENQALLPLYEDYFSGKHSPYSFVDGSRNGLDYFYLLQHYYPDYMQKVATLYREELYNKTLPFDGKEFLPYAMAKIYHVNILPSLEIWGENLTNQKLIKYIIDNSNKSIGFLVYDNDSFDKYKGISLKPTMLLPKQEGNDIVLTGIANPNSVIRAEYNGKTYKVTCGSDSKFTIKIPISCKGEIRVTAQTPGKAISPVTIINSNLSEYLNKKTLSIDGYAGAIATLSLNTENNTLNFYSTGQTPTGYSADKWYKYLTISILNSDREVLKSVTVQSRESLNEYQKLFNGMKYKNGDIIQVTVPNSVYGARLILNNLNNINENVNSFEYNNQHVYNILINDDKLVVFNPPTMNSVVNESDEISGKGVPGSTVVINIDNQNYSTIVNSKGEYTVKLPSKLKFGETVTAYTEFGDYKSLPCSEKVQGISGNKIILNNVWNQSLGTLGFNANINTIEVQQGNAIVNPYLNGEAFSIGLYNKDGNLIKNLTLDGSEWPESALSNAFNNLPYQYGDKIFLDYKTSSKISITNLIKNGKLNSSYKVDKPSVFEIEPQGLVYLGDSIKDITPIKGNVDISTVYANGKAVEGTKYNYIETGDVNTTIKNESIPSLENYHIDYVTVNGVKTPLDKLPKDYSKGTTDIVYHMAENAEYKLNIEVKTESEQVLSTIPTVAHFVGDKISVADNNWDKKEYKLDYILVDGVKTPANKLPQVMPDKNLNITYIVSPIAKSTITVEAVVDGKVLGKPVVTTNYQGEAYKEVTPTWNKNDYELKDITVNGVKTSEVDFPKVFGEKDTTIVYNLSPKMMNVGERVVNQNGDVLYHNEYKLPFNTSIVNIEDKIPSNYKLENITVSNPNNKDLILIANKNTNTYTNSNDVKVAFNGEVVSYNVVPINGEITYETQIGNEAPTNVVKEVGQVDTKSKEYKLNIPAGYEVESITVNGKKVDSVNDLDYKNKKQVVVYHLAKVSSDKSKENNKIVDRNDRTTINHSSIKQGDNKSAVKAEGNHKIENKPVINHNNQNKSSVDKNDSKSAIKPDENHESGNTENKPVVNHNNQNKPNTDTHEGSKVSPIKKEHGEVVIKVIDQSGKTIEEATHTGVVGLKFNPIVIPSKDKLVNITVNGKTVSENDVKNEIVSNPDTDNTTIIIYNVNVPEKKNNNQGSSVSPSDNKNINKTTNNKEDSTNTHNNDVKPIVNHKENNPSNSNKKKITEDGKVKVEVITSEGKVLLDSNYNEPVGSKISNIIIPKGYKLQSVSATVNGNKVQEVPTKVEKGETTIIYNVISDQPVVNHNEGSTDKHSDAKPVVNHNEGNTDKHSDAKPAVNHNEGNTDKHGDAKPVVNHNEGNTDKHGDVKPVVNHNEGNTENHNDAKPVVNQDGNAIDNGNINSGVSHSNSNSETVNKGSNGETVNKTGLPDTGLNNTEDGFGILAGIMAAIAALRIFRRKK
ncbi:Ig-like domain-containing protein [Clostridium mediterraneense]|uniref:Ig-like domain-containing protein n=1 Tax=Clostridium mediterraneense TaxID=1805472 RepID=UPI00082D0E9E|nr:Ig-like domain-containing protein [Clostridium mediterraneense]